MSAKLILNLFDYGDNWMFEVRLEDIREQKKLPAKPKVVETREMQQCSMRNGRRNQKLTAQPKWWQGQQEAWQR